jgi:hypothetical protein
MHQKYKTNTKKRKLRNISRALKFQPQQNMPILSRRFFWIDIFQLEIGKLTRSEKLDAQMSPEPQAINTSKFEGIL